MIVTNSFLRLSSFMKEPLTINEIMSIYNLSTQKTMMDKFTIETKILPILIQKSDARLSVSTVFYMVDSADMVVNDAVKAYYPIIDNDIILKVCKEALAHFPVCDASDLFRGIIDHTKYIIERVNTSSGSHKELASFKIKFGMFKDEMLRTLNNIQTYFYNNLQTAVGHAVCNSCSRTDSPICVGNACILSLNKGIDLNANDDLRQIAFMDVFNNDGMKFVDDISSAVGNTISSISNKSNFNGIIEGAAVVNADIYEQVMNYLVEVKCIASNLKETKTLYENTNYDLECDLYKDITSEDCVADVNLSKFGWTDADIITKGSDKDCKDISPDDKVKNILSKPQISGKNVQYVLGSLAVENDKEKRKAIVERLKDSVCETLYWEMTEENYSDLPVVHFMKRTGQVLESLTKNTEYSNRVSEAVSVINEAITNIVEEEGVPCTFNPCPSPLNLAPFPVGARATQLMFDNIYSAQTDEDMDKAMMELSKYFGNSEYVEEGKYSFTFRNMGKICANMLVDAQHTGKFELIHDRLLKMVDSCKSVDEIEYFQKDISIAMSLKKFRDRIKQLENGDTSGMDSKTIKYLEARMKKGLSSKSIDDHLKWIDTVLKPALSKKKKELKEAVTESNAISKGARAASRKVQNSTEKNIRKVGGTAHEVKQAVKNAVDPMERYITQTMAKIKKADTDERREILIKGGVMPKVLRWIKRSIPLIAGGAIGTVIPVAAVLTGISFLGFIASDKILDQKEKRKILRELEDEIQICNEKIDDSRGDENKQKKYELIRIRNNLKRTQDRILYNLKE